MIAHGPRYSKEDFARKGDEIYDRVVRPTISNSDFGKFVAIDIETEDFEIDQSEIPASDRLLERHPECQMWMTRIGSRYLHRFGGRVLGSTL
jgi:hypothetical protein